MYIYSLSDKVHYEISIHNLLLMLAFLKLTLSFLICFDERQKLEQILSESQDFNLI